MSFPGDRLHQVGIDFGTSNTAASFFATRGGKEIHEVIRLDQGPLLKSLLYFPSSREAYFGKQAIEKYFENDREGRFFQSIKRLLPNPDFSGTIVAGKYMSLESLIARFLTEVRRRIEAELRIDLSTTKVVFGRPAKYSLNEERERLATDRFRNAIESAGFRNYELLEEPTAASRVASTSDTLCDDSRKKKLTLVADLGGGTSDFTLIEKRYSEQQTANHKVLAVHGVPLAGDSLDSSFVSQRLLSFFGNEVKYQRPFSSNILTFPKSLINCIPKWHQHVVLKEKSNWNFLLSLRNELVDQKDKGVLENLITLVEENLGYFMHQKVEYLKISLSSLGVKEDGETQNFDFDSYPIRIHFPVSRSDYADVIQPVVDSIRKAALDTLEQAGVAPDTVDELYFTGGTSQVPWLRHAIRGVVPQAQVKDQNSFTAVALGLASPSGSVS